MTFRTIYAWAAATLLALGVGNAFAQDKTPPDTSVRALEAPTDVRKKQLRHKPLTHASHRRPRHRTVSTAIPRH